jgi:peptidoglycan/LPS O-acetylase OafA/YrhL
MRKAETFTALNGLRFLAALAVVIFHYAPRVAAYGRVPEVLKNLIDEGPAAVGFFFILSGFVLAHRHLYGEARIRNRAAFYWARFARLYPAYLLAFLLFLPIAADRYVLHPSPAISGRHTFLLSGILSCLMLQSWTPLAQAWNGPSWSLSVEVFLYFMFPLIGVRLVTLSRRGMAGMLLVSWLIPAGLAAAYVGRLIPESVWRLYVTNNPLLWLPLFVMGICAARFVPVWARIPMRTASTLSALGIVAVAVAAVAWPHQWADVFVTGGIAPLLVLLIVFFTRISGWITRIIGGPLLSRLGEASYALYILQAPLWHYWQEISNRLRGGTSQASAVALWQFLVFVPLLIVASVVVQRMVEAPLRARLVAWKTKAEVRESQKTIETALPTSSAIRLLET